MKQKKNHKQNRSSSQKTAAPGTNVRRHYDQKVLELGAKRGTGLVRQRTHTLPSTEKFPMRRGTAMK